MKSMQSFATCLPAFALLYFFNQQGVHAAVVANFTAGTDGTDEVDQWTGKAGSGWSGPWTTTGTSTAGVSSDSPINSSGNYLSVSTSTAIDDTGRARVFNPSTSGVSITASYTYSFDLRVDTLTGFTSNIDYLTVHGGTGGGVGPASTYIIRAFGANSGNAVANNWAFYNGLSDGGSYNQNNFVNSTMALTVGTTYHFDITVNPVTKTYTASINNGTTTVNSGAMGWRTATANSGIAFNERINATTDTIAYSVDNISIVPEPGAIALVGCFGILGLLRRSRA